MGKALEEILMQIEIDIFEIYAYFNNTLFSEDKLAEILLNVYLF